MVVAPPSSATTPNIFSPIHLHNLSLSSQTIYCPPEKWEVYIADVSSIYCSQLVWSETLKLHQFYILKPRCCYCLKIRSGLVSNSWIITSARHSLTFLEDEKWSGLIDYIPMIIMWFMELGNMYQYQIRITLQYIYQTSFRWTFFPCVNFKFVYYCLWMQHWGYNRVGGLAQYWWYWNASSAPFQQLQDEENQALQMKNESMYAYTVKIMNASKKSDYTVEKFSKQGQIENISDLKSELLARFTDRASWLACKTRILAGDYKIHSGGIQPSIEARVSGEATSCNLCCSWKSVELQWVVCMNNQRTTSPKIYHVFGIKTCFWKYDIHCPLHNQI